MTVRRFEIYLTRLDPTVGAEIRKTRPCVVISPDMVHHHLPLAVIAPLTTKRRGYPTRVDCEVGGKSGQVVLEQLRSVSPSRFGKKVGELTEAEGAAVLKKAAEMFAP